jgi:hypothetical protein
MGDPASAGEGVYLPQITQRTEIPCFLRDLRVLHGKYKMHLLKSKIVNYCSIFRILYEEQKHPNDLSSTMPDPLQGTGRNTFNPQLFALTWEIPLQQERVLQQKKGAPSGTPS